MDIFYTYCKEEDNQSQQEIQHKTGRKLLTYVGEKIYKIKNTEIEIIKKKPKFKYSNIKFSISHSEELVAICFDDEDIGFDIEKMKPRNYEAIAKRMKFPINIYTKENFYKEWTLFEAKYKLQNTANRTFSTIINKEYTISVASTRTTEIENIINIQEINNKLIS